MQGAEKGEKEQKARDPGASRHGNFINYYQFHPAEERLRQLTRDHVWRSLYSDRKYLALDIGCNAGDLSLGLVKFLEEILSQNAEKREISLLGVDLDPVLIERAKIAACNKNLLNNDDHRVSFECLDFMSDDRDKVFGKYLATRQRKRFDVAFCFSVTMWIHLNHGDQGLERFLSALCDLADMILVEPQAWKSYRNAARRLRRAADPVEDHSDHSGSSSHVPLESLRLRGDVASHIDRILEGQGFRKLAVTQPNNWQRQLSIYAKCQEQQS